eukprot:5429160-Pleurochrysis_carterae.AAC.1
MSCHVRVKLGVEYRVAPWTAVCTLLFALWSRSAVSSCDRYDVVTHSYSQTAFLVCLLATASLSRHTADHNSVDGGFVQLTF